MTGGLNLNWQASERLNVAVDAYYSGADFEQDLFLTSVAHQLTRFTLDARGGGPAFYSMGPDAFFGIGSGTDAISAPSSPRIRIRV